MVSENSKVMKMQDIVTKDFGKMAHSMDLESSRIIKLGLCMKEISAIVRKTAMEKFHMTMEMCMKEISAAIRKTALEKWFTKQMEGFIVESGRTTSHWGTDV